MGSSGSLTLPVGHKEQVQDFFVVWAHLGSSADLGQAGLGWAGARSYICSPKVSLGFVCGAPVNGKMSTQWQL